MVCPIMAERESCGMLGRAHRQVKLRGIARLHAGGDEKSSRILFRDQDLFLAQKIEVLVTAGTRIDDGGKVAGNIVGVTAVSHGKSKGDLQRDLGCANDFTLSPRLTEYRDFATGSNCIQERLAIARKKCGNRYYAGEQWDAFPIGDGHLIDSSL